MAVPCPADKLIVLRFCRIQPHSVNSLSIFSRASSSGLGMKRQTYQTPISLWSGKTDCKDGTNLAASACMPDAQLDQFIHALMWKAVPVVVLCGGGAILLRELLQRLERAADRAGRSRRKARQSSVLPVYHG